MRTVFAAFLLMISAQAWAQADMEPSHSGPLYLPIEIVSSGGEVIVSESIDLLGQANELWLEVYRAEHDVSVRVGSGSWVPFKSGKCDAKHVACFDERVPTSSFTLPLALQPGTNSVQFRFRPNKIGNNVRVIRLQPRMNGQPVGIANQILDRPTKTGTGNVANGRALFKAQNKWVEYPGGPKIKASCQSCHTNDGKYGLVLFDYSTNSVKARSKWHGATDVEASDIDAFLKAQKVYTETGAEYTKRGKPWFPPYQPGPGMSKGVALDWLIGTGIEGVEQDYDELKYAFAGADGLTRDDFESPVPWIDMPMPFQGPTWDRLWAIKHPIDCSPNQTLLNEYYAHMASMEAAEKAKNYSQVATMMHQLGNMAYEIRNSGQSACPGDDFEKVIARAGAHRFSFVDVLSFQHEYHIVSNIDRYPDNGRNAWDGTFGFLNCNRFSCGFNNGPHISGGFNEETHQFGSQNADNWWSMVYYNWSARVGDWRGHRNLGPTGILDIGYTWMFNQYAWEAVIVNAQFFAQFSKCAPNQKPGGSNCVGQSTANPYWEWVLTGDQRISRWGGPNGLREADKKLVLSLMTDVRMSTLLSKWTPSEYVRGTGSRNYIPDPDPDGNINTWRGQAWNAAGTSFRDMGSFLMNGRRDLENFGVPCSVVNKLTQFGRNLWPSYNWNYNCTSTAQMPVDSWRYNGPAPDPDPEPEPDPTPGPEPDPTPADSVETAISWKNLEEGTQFVEAVIPNEVYPPNRSGVDFYHNGNFQRNDPTGPNDDGDGKFIPYPAFNLVAGDEVLVVWSDGQGVRRFAVGMVPGVDPEPEPEPEGVRIEIAWGDSVQHDIGGVLYTFKAQDRAWPDTVYVEFDPNPDPGVPDTVYVTRTDTVRVYPEAAATGGGYFEVYVNGVKVSQHSAEREAAIRAANEAIKNPGAQVEYRHPYTVRITTKGK